MQELSAPAAVVKRDGEWKTLEVRELVPGDLIELKGGDVIPGDAVVGPSPGPRQTPFHCIQQISCHVVEVR